MQVSAPPRTTSAHFSVHPMCGAGGAEISGLDLAQPLHDDVIQALHQTLANYCLLVFRQQTLTPDQQKTFARGFGSLSPTPFIQPLEGHPEMMRIVREPNETKKLNFGGRWHTDMTFSPEPVLGTCLYARESPPVGGDTLWTNQMQAYDALSPGLQRQLQGMRVMHSAKRSYGPQGTYADDDLKSMRIQVSDVATREQAHPCIRTHPVHGRPILFINWVYAVRFEDMTEEESAPLLDYLNRHSQRPEFQIRLRWTQGTLALWDNRATQHLAINDYAGYRRVMDRLTIAGDAPYFRA